MCAQSFARAEQLPNMNRCRCSAVGRSEELGRAPGLAEGVWSFGVDSFDPSFSQGFGLQISPLQKDICEGARAGRRGCSQL